MTVASSGEIVGLMLPADGALALRIWSINSGSVCALNGRTPVAISKRTAHKP
jgi:hypothetical protein